MLGQASDNVIKQAQALRQNFRVHVRGNLHRQRPLHLSTHEYEFQSLPPQDKPKASPKRSPVLHKHSLSITTDRVSKYPTSKKTLKYSFYHIPLTVKTIDHSDFRTKEREVFIKRQKHALDLHLPVPEYRPISQESFISKSSVFIHNC
ncbi:hypothetical protein SteCoe_28627 [Stentor coeruleus]|uniref:Uncharacterized protein n=1 Tax=Stentor coeruleus TaxID=5963 RepID=A0A1R2B7U9_9CILI|nr:hypothetical protein SteCoe_28627 [Stentor coeruleus]